MLSVAIADEKYDPYKVLCIANPKSFTAAELKSNYKSLALQLHPDKNRLSPEASKQVFQVLTQCYKALLRELEAKASDKTYDELKSAFVDTTNNSRSNSSHNASAVPHASASSFASSTNFNVDRFNQVFADNRLKSVNDSGYNNWMKKFNPEDPRVLSEIESAQKRKEMHLIKYSEPAALHIVKSKSIGFEELGVDRIDDFSKDPAATDRKQLAFTDYRVAHTTTRIIDPELVQQRKEYRSVQELESERANVQFEMSQSELARYNVARRRQELLEQRRVESLRKYDTHVDEHHQRMHRLLLAGGRS